GLAGTAARVWIGRQHAGGVPVRIDRRVDDHHFERAFLVPIVARQGLVLPDNFPRLGLDRKACVGARHSPTDCSALCLRSGTGSARSVINEVEIGIVSEKAQTPVIQRLSNGAPPQVSYPGWPARGIVSFRQTSSPSVTLWPVT